MLEQIFCITPENPSDVCFLQTGLEGVQAIRNVLVKKMPVSQRNSLVAPLCWQRLMLRRGYDRTLLAEIEMLKPSKRAVR